MRRYVWVGVGFFVVLGIGAFGEAQPKIGPQPKQHFDKQIASLLVRRCLDCHSGVKPRGGLDLTSSKSALQGGENGKAIVPGDAQASLLWKHVHSGKMPPKNPLPAGEKALLQHWIDGGAIWGTEPIDPFQFTTETRAGYDWWSLQPVVRPKLPRVQKKDWTRNEIDYFVLTKLEENQLSPSPEADRQTLIRRLYFDLLGLPPSPDEVQTFVQDKSADAYEKLVDRLLASPHYGERWARHWLDVVRFGESNGFEHDELRSHSWPYRDWVIQALNSDLPFDQFTRLQLAGDILLPNDPAGIMATGFLVAGGYDTVGQQQQSAAMKAVVRQDELEDIVGTVGQTFLGLTVHCARCHDHKFDPIRQKEYYQLTAALSGVFPGERKLGSPEFQKQLAAQQQDWKAELAQLQKQLRSLEEPIRVKILEDRKKTGKPSIVLPTPLASWNFSSGLKDQAGSLHATLHGDAKQEGAGLVVPGKNGYASTPPLPKDVKARTLTARVQLANLTQKGGAVLSLQSLDGNVFDAIVFGERDPGQWMAGSDFFKRTQSFHAPAETEANTKPVHLAIVYDVDGTITAYRNGQPYGKPYKSVAPLNFAANQAKLVFGVRHTPALPGRLLAGTILHAALFDTPLSPKEVAALANSEGDFISEKEILVHLGPAEKEKRDKWTARIKQVQALLDTPPAQKVVYAVAPRQPGAVHLLIRGNPAQKGETVKAAGVASLNGLNPDFGLSTNATDPERRKKLAEWITHPGNPLFPRVIVNRLWQHHFGRGLVEMPNDFGFNGGQPSHPELLDWLANELVRQKYSLKAIHRLMVTSATYRQASRYNSQAAKVDANNRWLWRKSPVRLEAEVVRDSILSVASQLNSQMGGPGFKDFKVAVRGATYSYTPLDPVGFDFQRRTIYRTWARSGRNNMLDSLDCPDPSTATHKRQFTTTPLQALTLLNNSFVLRMVDHFASRVKKEAGADVKKQITRAYWLAYGRPPTAKEMTAVQPVVEANGLFVLCRAIFNSNEFLYID